MVVHYAQQTSLEEAVANTFDGRHLAVQTNRPGAPEREAIRFTTHRTEA